MNTTAAQNSSHRTDVAWTKSKGKHFKHNGETYISEYVNLFTGRAIRKDWRMTGADWYVFDANGTYVTRSHSLTWAKMEAGE